ncbi:MAG TPA: hypothetical protein VGQ44_13185 [Gemmatimonadaceae bacterium]|nr:hypothetical protein [Gemmatimonadaceae bacterium]
MNRGTPDATGASRVVRNCLAGAIDYAGLFPPAALDMRTAVRNYASYRAGDDAALLGRFVVPVARLNELVGELDSLDARNVSASAVLGPNLSADCETVAAFNMPPARARVDAIEAKAERPGAIYELVSKASPNLDVFVELPLEGELESLVAAVRAVGARAKIRTGGVTTGAFPSARSVVRFMRACLDAAVPFKATAGLHHPVTGTYALTYAPDAPRGVMFGFLNVFLAAAYLGQGMSDEDAARLLDDRDASAFSFGDDGAEWRGRHIDADRLASTHARAFGSFGSCSFNEPVGELRGLALLS